MCQSLIPLLQMTNLCIAMFLFVYVFRLKGGSFQKQEAGACWWWLLQLRCSVCEQCRPATHQHAHKHRHTLTCVRLWRRGEGLNLHSASSVLQVTAWRSAALSLSSAGVPATASALIFNQTRTGRNWFPVCCYCWSCFQTVEFLEIQVKQPGLVPIT